MHVAWRRRYSQRVGGTTGGCGEARALQRFGGPAGVSGRSRRVQMSGLVAIIWLALCATAWGSCQDACGAIAASCGNRSCVRSVVRACRKTQGARCADHTGTYTLTVTVTAGNCDPVGSLFTYDLTLAQSGAVVTGDFASRIAPNVIALSGTAGNRFVELSGSGPVTLNGEACSASALFLINYRGRARLRAQINCPEGSCGFMARGFVGP